MLAVLAGLGRLVRSVLSRVHERGERLTWLLHGTSAPLRGLCASAGSLANGRAVAIGAASAGNA